MPNPKLVRKGDRPECRPNHEMLQGQEYTRRNICLGCDPESIDHIAVSVKVIDASAKILRRHRLGNGRFQLLIECRNERQMIKIKKMLNQIKGCNVWE